MYKQHCEQPDQTRIVALLSEKSHVPIDEIATLYKREETFGRGSNKPWRRGRS